MIKKEYQIIGKGRDTGRKRKKIYFAENEIDAKQQAENDGTLIDEIIEIPLPAPEPATEKQLSYADALGIDIPDNPTKLQLMALIDLKVNKDKPATERHLSFAKHFNINIDMENRYVLGKKNLFRIIFAELLKQGREKDLVSWFTFRVYRHLVEGDIDVEIQTIGHDIINEIAETLYQDPKIINSIKRYDAEKLIWFGEFIGHNSTVYTGGSEKTYAYKKVKEMLRDRVKLPMSTRDNPRQKTRTEEKKKANIVLVIFALIALFLYYLNSK